MYNYLAVWSFEFNGHGWFMDFFERTSANTSVLLDVASNTFVPVDKVAYHRERSSNPASVQLVFRSWS